jgi:hypothetical protein
MKPIVTLNAIESRNDNELAVTVTISQGEDLINTGDEMQEVLRDSIPSKKGITGVERIFPHLWIVTYNKDATQKV